MFGSIKVLVRSTLIMTALVAALAHIPDAAAVTTRHLVEVVDISGPVVSQDGASVAFRTEQASIERNTYDSVWYVQRMDGSAPARRVADGGVPLRDTAGVSLEARAEWSPDGRWVYFRARMDGRIDVWRAAADGSGAEPVTSDPADVRDFSLSADGKLLVYTVGATREEVIAAEQAEYDKGIRLAHDVPIGQALFRSSNIEGRWATQRYTGLGFDRAALLSDLPDRRKVVDVARRTERHATRSEVLSGPTTATELPEGISEPWKFTVDRTAGRIALLRRIGEGAGLLQKPGVKLSMLNGLGDGREVDCNADLCIEKGITGIQWRPGTDEVLFTVTDEQQGRAQSIFRWDVTSGIVLPVAESAGLLNGGREPGTACSLSREAMACVVADVRRPPRLEKIEVDTGLREVLFDPNKTLAYDMAAMVDVQLLRWTDATGQVFTGQYFRARAADTGPTPLFVNYYSCSGFLRGGLGDEWPFATLAQNGISALCINYAPLRSDAIDRFNQALSAVESAVELLSSQGEIDRSKVGMGGLSFGSSVTMWVAMRSDLLAAASVASGVISPSYYLWGRMKGEGFLASLRYVWGLGALDETPQRWQILSPAFNLDRIHAPVLFQIPEQEYLFSLDYVVPMIKADRAELYVFPNEPHQKFQPRHKLAVYDKNLDWFRYWLQGYEDPDPAKRRQYLHWRQMEPALPRRHPM